ncbi:hypothetical protein KY312_00260 [Candidatus Woesearchaeota archaeon]|nr:hypothetical protein [Candidatus Woesearchaeota archaeon]
MKTAVYASDEAIYVVSNEQDNQQSIFNIGKNVVFGEDSTHVIEALHNKYGNSEISAEKLANVASDILKTGNLYICGRDKTRLNIYKVDNKD